MKKLSVFLFAMLLFFGIVGIASATLIDQGCGLIYDDELEITWLQNANLAATETFGVSGINSDGMMSWYTANDWIDAMNASSYLGYKDWRLPLFEGIPMGINELGYMYWQNMSANQTMNKTGNQTVGEVTLYNISDYPYCTNYLYVGEEWDETHTQSFAFGLLDAYRADFDFPVWAVRSGDISAPAPVPEPATILLIGTGLIGMSMFGRKKLKK